jgi:hypothetical protein
MADHHLPSASGLPEVRESAVQQLCAHYAADTLEAAEFERRLDRAYAAVTVAELHTLLGDLPPLPEAVREAPYTLARPENVSTRQLAFALMGASERSGAWTPPRHMIAVALMGGVELDYREAHFPAGVSEITCVALMGAVEIVVPPWVRVEVNGIAVMGAFEKGGEGETALEPGSPVLRVGGLATWGAVEITVRLPGESARDARRRLRDERRLKSERLRLRG